MTQINLPVMVSPTSGAQLVENLENWRDALHSMHSGIVRPDYVLPQMMWIDTSATPWVLKVFQGSDDIVLGNLDPTTLNFTPSAVDGGTITGVPASNISYDGGTVEQALNEIFNDPYATKQLLEPFPVLDPSLIPSNAGTRKYIILSAGQTGSGGYNEGLITQSVGGTFPTNTAVGTILVGPMAGKQIELMNSTRRAIIGGETQGVENDQTQVVTGSLSTYLAGSGLYGESGALDSSSLPSAGIAPSTSTGVRGAITFNSANSPNARTGTYTRGRGWVIPHYARIM